MGQVMAKSSLIICLFLTFACGEKTNILGYLVMGKQKKDIVYLLERSQTFYDQGDFTTANTFAQEAYDIDPSYEASAVMLGFTHLALAGLDSFNLATSLMKDDSSANLAEESQGGALDGLRGVIGLSQTDLNELTLADNKYVDEEGNVVEGAPSEGIFAELPVLLPKSAVEARLTNSVAVSNVHKAIVAVCPFVSLEAKVIGSQGDIRHVSDYCETTDNERYLSAKAHYLWAFSHLTEAIAFHSVVLFQTVGSEPNLVQRSSVLDKAGGDDIQGYIKNITDLATTIDIILPTDEERSKNSMLTAMFNDLEATSLGFAQLAGIPESLTKSITDSLAEIKSQKEKLASSSGSANQQNSKALKENLTKGLKSALQTQITAKDAEGIEEGEKEDMCKQYCQISTESFDSCDCGT